MQKRFSGVVVPMITPLLSDLTIDNEAVIRIVNSFSENGLHPLVLGTTGESCSVNEINSLKLVKAAVNARGKDQIIYAGLVGNQVEELVKRGNLYIQTGADVVVATLPSYYSLTPQQMTEFYTFLADNIKGPVMMYNIKATTQMSIPADVVAKLSDHPNIYGLKDSERDYDRMKTFIEIYKDRPDFSFYCGWGAQGAGSLKLGADGIVPSTGNIVPELYGKLYQAYLDGDLKSAAIFQEETDKVALVYQQGRTLGQSLAVLKVMMSIKDLCGTEMMPPLTKLSKQEVEILHDTYCTLLNH